MTVILARDWVAVVDVRSDDVSTLYLFTISFFQNYIGTSIRYIPNFPVGNCTILSLTIVG